MIIYLITTFNEEQNIESCIKSLKQAGVSSEFIYVVDSYSTDATKEISAA